VWEYREWQCVYLRGLEDRSTRWLGVGPDKFDKEEVGIINEWCNSSSAAMQWMHQSSNVSRVVRVGSYVIRSFLLQRALPLL